MWIFAQWLLWAGIATLFLTYIGYPLVLAVAALLSPNRQTSVPKDGLPPMTLVISLHDEKVVIEDKLRNALALVWPGGVTILLADDGSTDGSEEVCRRAAVDHPGRVLHVRITRGGKNRALNEALKVVRGGIVVFTDANAMFEKDALQRIGDAFVEPRAGCVIGQLRFRKDGQSMEGTYWRYENLVKDWPTICRSPLPSLEEGIAAPLNRPPLPGSTCPIPLPRSSSERSEWPRGDCRMWGRCCLWLPAG